MKRSIILGVAGLATMTGGALAQLPYVQQNPGLEWDWHDANPPRASGIRFGNLFGWTNNNDTAVRMRTLIDGLNPPAMVRNGVRSMELSPIAAGSSCPTTEDPDRICGVFNGYTTDTQENFGCRNAADTAPAPCPPGVGFSFLFFDVPMRWIDGPIVLTYWCNVPVGSALQSFPTAAWPTDLAEGASPFPPGLAPGGTRLDIKGVGNGNRNAGTLDTWSYAYGHDIMARYHLIAGDTGGQWVKKKVYWPARTPDQQGWKDKTEAAAGVGDDPYFLPPVGTWPNPNYPNIRWPDRVKLTIGRFNATLGAGFGSAFIDDLSFVQQQRACNLADVGMQGGTEGADGLLDNNDFVVFINMFFEQDIVADLGKQGGIYGHDLLWDNNDFVVYIGLFFSACDPD